MQVSFPQTDRRNFFSGACSKFSHTRISSIAPSTDLPGLPDPSKTNDALQNTRPTASQEGRGGNPSRRRGHCGASAISASRGRNRRHSIPPQRSADLDGPRTPIATELQL